MAARHHRVYATARKDEDLDALSAFENVIPIQLDVRKPEQIQAAHDFIAQQGTGLYGLVNNAGIGSLGLLSTWTDAEMFEIFDVNVFGVHRMTNTFIRMLIAAQGRVVNIGSQGGMLTSKYYGPYTMTKHAIEAYSVALGLELENYGVKVSVVQPGGIISDVGKNAFPGMLARFQRAEPPFKAEADQFLANLSQPSPARDAEAPESETNRKPSSPEIVAVAVYDALMSAQPKKCYLVGTKWEGDRVIHRLVEKLLEENDNPQHHYSRDELIQILDQHIKHLGYQFIPPGS
ncbi:MAG: SDR family NAD(P)-dependent oxidoreductase [Anaerolineales bacterium]|nr:SDR family NAD(P)-dependent oxidoreductase [Anaerolineales bacterium]